MDKAERIDPKDAKFIKWLMLPGFFAFMFLGLISEGGAWSYWLMLLGGWYLSALIGWHMYKFFIIDRNPSSKLLFYSNYVLAQVGLVTLVYFFIRIEYGI
jgi:hypothetical protein